MKNNEKQPFSTPKQVALATFLLCFGIMCIGAVLFDSIGINTHFGILFAGIVGLFLYKRKYPLNLAEQIRNYDVKIPLIVTLVNISCCEFCSSLFGLIASQFMEVKSNHTSKVTVIAFIFTVIVAPISEELIFRLCGVGLLKKHYSKKFTILFTTMIFAVIHFYNIQGMFDVFVGAIWFALCYYYTENIFYTITAHMLHNIFSTLEPSSLYNTVNGFSILHMPWFVLSAFLFAISIVLFVKTFSKVEYKEQQAA